MSHMNSNQSILSYPDVEYKYKFFVYPNITLLKDIEKDSYIEVIRNVIRVLNNRRSDIHFTLLLPKYVESLKVPNVDQQIYPVPKDSNAMRTHFDYGALHDIVNWQCTDYDVVYSHLPEHTLQLANLFGNQTNIAPM